MTIKEEIQIINKQVKYIKNITEELKEELKKIGGKNNE